MARCKLGLNFVSIFLILLISAFSSASAKPANKVTAASAPSRWLAGVLSSGAQSLLEQAKEATDRAAKEQSGLADTTAQLEELQRKMAILKTGLEVTSLPTPIISEILNKYSATEDDLSSRLDKSTREIKETRQRLAKQNTSLLAIDAQIKILKSSNQPGVWTVDIQAAYDKYRGACATLAEASGSLVNVLSEKTGLLKQQKELLGGVVPRLKALQKASMGELMQCGGSKPLGQQLHDLLRRLLTMPRTAWSSFSGRLHSRQIKAFLLKTWAPMIGLLLFIAFLGWGARVCKRRLESLLAYIHPYSRETEVVVLVKLASGVVALSYPIACFLWMAAACAALGLLDVVAALTVLYVAGGLLVLVLSVRVIRDILCGSETEKSCVPNIAPNAVAGLRRGLEIFTAYLVMGGVFIQILGLDNFPITLKLLVSQLYGIGVLFGTCLLLRPGYLKRILERPLSPRWTKWLGFLWAAWLLLLTSVCLMELLGFQSFSIYAISGAVLTEALIACALFLAVTGAGVLREIFERDHALLEVFDAIDIEFRQLYFPARLALSALLIAGFIVGLLLAWGIGMASLLAFFDHLSKGVNLGSLHLSPITLLAAAAVLYAGFRGSGVFRTILRSRVLPRTGWDLGVQYSIATVLQYTIIIGGVLLAMNILGFPLASLALLAGALGLGAGLGLQSVIANFVSGLVLLFERPVKVGDLLVFDGQWGEVKAIKMRSTVFQTFDRSVLIIPNSDLLSGKIVNWSHYGAGPNRLTLKVGVSYSSDVKLVTHLLQEICKANPRVLKDPLPQTFFEAYGDSSLDFCIRVFVATANDRVPVTHEINTAIFEAFLENGIEIPFPQRDLHIINDKGASVSDVEDLIPLACGSAHEK